MQIMVIREKIPKLVPKIVDQIINHATLYFLKHISGKLALTSASAKGSGNTLLRCHAYDTDV